MDELLREKDAIRFRSDWGINTKEAIRFKSLLQKLNVITVFKPLSTEFSGMAIKTEDQFHTNRFILINSTQSIGKQHFTICHELYHLFVQRDFTSMVCKTGLFDKKTDKEEYNADIFASHLLLPTEGLIELIPTDELESKVISLKTVVYLEQFFSCSRRALLYRLKKLKLISENNYNLFCTNVIKSAAEYGYDTSLYKKGNENLVIGDYGSIAKDLYDKDSISQSHYFSLLNDLGVDVNELENDTNGAD